MSLDVPTLFVVITTVALLMAFWVGVMAWGKPAGDPMRVWLLAMLAYGLSGVLFGLREQIGLLPSLLLGNGLSAAAVGLMLLAVRRSQGLRASGWFVIVPAVLLPLALLPLSHDYPARVALVALVLAFQVGMVMWALLDQQHPVRSRGRYILAVSFLVLGATLLMRGVAVAMGWVTVESLLHNSPLQALTLLVSLCTVLSIALGFVYMEFERIERLSFELAMKDVLTGLLNRRAISDELQAALARAHRQSQPLSVLLLDIDHFKLVNDSLGHQAGDKVLCAVAQTLQSRLRAQDSLGRFGGEEFLLLLPDTAASGAQVVAEALRAAVAATVVTWSEQRITVTVSVGLRAGPVTAADTPDSLVAAADIAMYAAKRGGRNRVELCPPPLGALATLAA